MKKIFTTILAILGIVFLMASDFEGVISQDYYDGIKDFTVRMDWTIKEDKVSLVMATENGMSTFLIQNDIMYLFSDRQVTSEGTPYYFKLHLDEIEQNLSPVDFLKVERDIEITEFDKSARKISFVGGWQGELVFIPMENKIGALSFFKDSYELLIMNKNGWAGIPITATVKDKSGAVLSILETISIEEKSIDNSIFEIPKNAVNVNSISE